MRLFQIAEFALLGFWAAGCLVDGALAQDMSARGVLRPINEAVVSTQLSARINHLTKRPGERFDKDEVLVGFDCTRYKSEVRAARAEQSALEKEYETNVKLATYDAIGTNEVEIALARLNSAKAKAGIAASYVVDCEIPAPFAGKVISVDARPFETNVPGQPIIHIIDDSKMEVELIVPSSWLVWLEPGIDVAFQVDETQSLHELRIARIGGEVDPVSQTVRIYGVLNGTMTSGLLSGMSGTAFFELPVN